MSNLPAALKYLELGFSVIPVRSDSSKRPLVTWEEFQKKRADEVLIKEWWKQFPEANVGIVTGRVSGAVVIDIDDPEEAYPVLNNLIRLKNLKTPSCTTPSGGYHYYFKCPDEPLRNNAKLIPGADFRGEGGYVVAPNSSINGKQYKWIVKPTECSLLDLPVAYIEYVTEKKSKPSQQVVPVDPQLDVISQGRRDESLFHIANSLVKGKCDPELMRMTLKSIAQNVCDPPFPENEVDIKVDSAIKRVSEYSFTTDAVKEHVMDMDGEFHVKDIYQHFNVTDRGDKKIICQLLRRMVEGNIIERFGSKNGVFRRVDDNLVKIEIQEQSNIKPIDIVYPLGIEQYVKTFSRNIMIVAGEKDHGKSAFCLAFAEMNRQLAASTPPGKISYFLSEMAGEEISDRISNTQLSIAEWSRYVDFYDRVENFHDVIQPDGINVVDYLLLTDNFYAIAENIKRIYEKLRKGICLVALQKDRGHEYGMGAMKSAYHARMYITLSSEKGVNRATILHGKNRAMKEINPNGLSCEYKLVKGCEFKRWSEWGRV